MKLHLPPVYFLVCFVLVVEAHYFYPLARIIPWPITMLGVLFVLLGVGMMAWVKMTFQKRKTTIMPHGKPTVLVTTGLFQYTRNPIYVGFTLILFATAFVFGSVTSFIFPIIFILIMNTFFIPLEEKNLQKSFKKKY